MRARDATRVDSSARPGTLRHLSSLFERLQCDSPSAGKDDFTPSEADDLFAFCVAFEKEHGAVVHHETHRARILYSPWIAKEVRIGPALCPAQRYCTGCANHDWPALRALRCSC